MCLCLQELDMSSCFVSNAAAAFAKRQLERVKEKKEKKDRKSDSGKESPKPCADQQNSKTHQKEVGRWAGVGVFRNFEDILSLKLVVVKLAYCISTQGVLG